VRATATPSSLPGDYEFRHQVRVRFAETDAMGIVHHSRYLPMMEEARVAYLRHIDHPYQSIRDDGMEMAVIEVFLQYRQPLLFDDLVDVHVTLATVDRASFQMAYLLTVDGEARATGVTVHGCTRDGRPTRLPPWLKRLDPTAPAPPAVVIATDRLSVEVAPGNGGRLAQITGDGVELLVGRADGPDPGATMAWGSYPMVPWAGRIRRGQFTFDGVEHSVPVNFGGHAIHGVGFDLPWAVTRHDADRVELELAMPSDRRWPFGGVSRQTIAVDGAVVRCELSVTAGAQAMPATLGWHPWFRKPDRFEFHPTAMYERDDEWIAVDRLVDVPDRAWDDCFINVEPVRFSVGGVDLRMTSGCDHWVVFDMRDHATCVEPQTGPPDAFNIRPNRLEPGETLTAWFELAIE
jgi:aldose 1-epimerase